MDKATSDAKVEAFLFGRGVRLEDYYIQQKRSLEVLCYTNFTGRHYDLLIDDPDLAAAAMRRLKELGVRVVTS